jgi:hypothetical protein
VVQLLLYNEAWRQVWSGWALKAAAKRLEKRLVMERVPHHLVARLTHLLFGIPLLRTRYALRSVTLLYYDLLFMIEARTVPGALERLNGRQRVF